MALVHDDIDHAKAKRDRKSALVPKDDSHLGQYDPPKADTVVPDVAIDHGAEKRARKNALVTKPTE